VPIVRGFPFTAFDDFSPQKKRVETKMENGVWQQYPVLKYNSGFSFSFVSVVYIAAVIDAASANACARAL
jgi:hypothetical protein